MSVARTDPIATDPESAAIEPAAMPTRVDLPAPFSPTSACISPRLTVSETFFNA
jgi:hypothetical protein